MKFYKIKIKNVMSKFHNPNTTQNSQSNNQNNETITITSLATKAVLKLQSNPNNPTEKLSHYNNLIYSMDSSNDLFIKDKDSNTTLLTLSNYKCYIKALQANANAKNPINAYILDSILYPNKTYSTFGIKLELNQPQDTFSNKGNFEIHLCNINLQEIESQSKGTIIKDTPIFCYNQHSKQTTMAKLDNNTLTIRTQMSESIINKAKQGLINPCFVNLSFMYFSNKFEANNKSSQKIALTADDINKGSVTIENKIPNIPIDKSKSIVINQTQSNKSKETLSIRFNGKELQILENGKAINRDFTISPLSLSNPKELVKESKDYILDIKNIPAFIATDYKYTLFMQDKNNHIATITNKNTKNIRLNLT